uniref:Uncharacterized protein n=1 Tax=Oryzias melastigma TaxID=30732 RepID=A0A3B3BAC9_ORYME
MRTELIHQQQGGVLQPERNKALVSTTLIQNLSQLEVTVVELKGLIQAQDHADALSIHSCHVAQKDLINVHQHEIIHLTDFVLCENAQSQELWVNPGLTNCPEQFRSLFLKVPQQAHSMVHVVNCQFGFVVTHHIKHFIFNRAGLQSFQDLVFIHCRSMKESFEAAACISNSKHLSKPVLRLFKSS